MKAVLIILAILGIGYLMFSSNNNPSYSPSYSYQPKTYHDEDLTISYEEAIQDYWSEIQYYLDGTEEVEACSDSSGNCYSLQADINAGYIETLYFDNGGYLEFYAEIDENGYAYDSDEDDNNWEFKVSPYFIKSAVEEWADENGYTLE